MKKAISILLALVMCFALAMPAFAADLPDVNDPVETEATLPNETPDAGLSGDVLGQIMDAIQGALGQLGEVKVDEIVAALQDALKGVGEGDAASQIRDVLAKFIKLDQIPDGVLKDLINKIINIYYPLQPEVPETTETTEAPTEPETEETTTEAPVPPETGDSAVALAVFATVSVAAAAAFVCTKKKA